MKSQVRAFIAIEIASEVRSGIDRLARRLQSRIDGVKWVTPDQFHLTLKFLGDVPMTEIYEIVSAMKRACQGTEPFDLVFEGLGAFPNLEAPKTLWIGVKEGIDPSRTLAGRIDAELEKLGFPRESRRFTPHLTIGRVKANPSYRGAAPSAAVSQQAELEAVFTENASRFFGVSSVDSILLFSSELSRQGPKYEVLSEVDFK